MKDSAIVTYPVIIAIILFVFIGAGLIFTEVFSARVEARLYNEKYRTHYTTSDFYWAGSTIKKRLHVQKEETYNLKIDN